jgi:hypothetical protein
MCSPGVCDEIQRNPNRVSPHEDPVCTINLTWEESVIEDQILGQLDGSVDHLYVTAIFM